ncbi:MAG: hypothetical protein KAV00_02220 [Phycisphaerae bacterium]|nr:hypothetical protein [Phycisphaerae bacterium]
MWFLLNHAFKDLNLHRVRLHVFSTNARAIKVYEKTRDLCDKGYRAKRLT